MREIQTGGDRRGGEELAVGERDDAVRLLFRDRGERRVRLQAGEVDDGAEPGQHPAHAAQRPGGVDDPNEIAGLAGGPVDLDR